MVASATAWPVAPGALRGVVRAAAARAAALAPCGCAAARARARLAGAPRRAVGVAWARPAGDRRAYAPLSQKPEVPKRPGARSWRSWSGSGRGLKHKQRPSSIVHAGCGRRRRVPPSREPAPVPRLAASRGRVFVKSPHAFTIYCAPLMQYAHMCDVARSRRNAMKHGHDQSRPRNWRRHAYSPWYPAS